MNTDKKISRIITLMWVAMTVFQVVTMLLLAYREEVVNEAAKVFAWAMPLTSWALYLIVYKGLKTDGILLLTMLFLCSVSLAILTRNANSEQHHVDQAIFMLIGLVVMLIAIWVGGTLERWNDKWIWILSGAALAALLLPRAFKATYGAYNWIPLGPVSIQPSEFVKVFLPIMMAHFAVKPSKKGGWLIVACMIAAVYCGVLALIQADLGAMVIYFVVAVGLYYIGGGSAVLALGAFGLVVLAGVVLLNTVPRVQIRFAVWENPMIDPAGKGYQIIQSLVALGSAGWMGRGLGKGASYLINLYNSDGVFPAICEEFGLLFGLLLMGIYMVMVWRGITVACRSNNKFRRLVATGISLSFGAQTMLIVAGITKLIPLTGVTLPFVASGGSSMISSMLAMGILLRYSMKEKKTSGKRISGIR